MGGAVRILMGVTFSGPETTLARSRSRFAMWDKPYRFKTRADRFTLLY